MKRLARLLVTAFFLAGISVPFAIADSDWMEYECHEYKLIKDCGNWVACEDLAVSGYDAHLVTIEDADEDDYLAEMFGTTALFPPDHLARDFNIGLYDQGGGNWVWVSNGEPAVYQNWRSGQPSSGAYVRMGHDILPERWDWRSGNSGADEAQREGVAGESNPEPVVAAGTPQVGGQAIQEQADR